MGHDSTIVILHEINTNIFLHGNFCSSDVPQQDLQPCECQVVNQRLSAEESLPFSCHHPPSNSKQRCASIKVTHKEVRVSK